MMHSSTQPCNEGLSCGGHPIRPSRGAHRPSPQRKRYLHLKRWIRRQYRPRLLQRRMSWCGAPRLNWNRCARRSAALPPRILARACGGCSSGQPKPLETRGCSSGSCSRSCSSCSRSCRSSNISIAAAAVAERAGSARKCAGPQIPGKLWDVQKTPALSLSWRLTYCWKCSLRAGFAPFSEDTN